MKSADRTYQSLLLFLLIVPFSVMSACDRNPRLTTEYQAVFLDNGQVYFGKLEGLGTSYPTLRDVFYVQSEVGPEKQVTSILVKRGNEWHKPTEMHLNSKHILVIEPIAADSRVAQLIKEANAKKPEGGK